MKKLVSLPYAGVCVLALLRHGRGQKHVENLIVGTTAANNTFNMTTQSDAFGRMNYNGSDAGQLRLSRRERRFAALFFHQLRDFGRR
ncbi:MAG: hypothetical protein ACLUMK_09140 [Christensenellales bacterium]